MILNDGLHKLTPFSTKSPNVPDLTRLVSYVRVYLVHEKKWVFVTTNSLLKGEKKVVVHILKRTDKCVPVRMQKLEAYYHTVIAASGSLASVLLFITSWFLLHSDYSIL